MPGVAPGDLDRRVGGRGSKCPGVVEPYGTSLVAKKPHDLEHCLLVVPADANPLTQAVLDLTRGDAPRFERPVATGRHGLLNVVECRQRCDVCHKLRGADFDRTGLRPCIHKAIHLRLDGRGQRAYDVSVPLVGSVHVLRLDEDGLRDGLAQRIEREREDRGHDLGEVRRDRSQSPELINATRPEANSDPPPDDARKIQRRRYG